MPRCRSYYRVLADGGVLSDAQRARRERDEKFKQLPQSDLSFSGVPHELKSPLTRMLNGRLLHQELADSTGCSSPSGKVCAHVAFKQGVLDRSMYQSVRMRLEHADEGKHAVTPAAVGATLRQARSTKAKTLRRGKLGLTLMMHMKMMIFFLRGFCHGVHSGGGEFPECTCY